MNGFKQIDSLLMKYIEYEGGTFNGISVGNGATIGTATSINTGSSVSTGMISVGASASAGASGTASASQSSTVINQNTGLPVNVGGVLAPAATGTVVSAGGVLNNGFNPAVLNGIPNRVGWSNTMICDYLTCEPSIRRRAENKNTNLE